MILEIKNISKKFGKKSILKQVNLKIKTPRLIALVAPNGSGKTTLMNIICNLEKTDGGEVKILGLRNDSQAIFSKLSYMQDNSILYGNLSGWDHINLVSNLQKVSEKRLNQIIDYLEIRNYLNKKVKYYSLGMKQHLLFALSVLQSPKVLLLDEPINGLDPLSVKRVKNFLTEIYKDQSTTIIFSSHNLEQVEQITSDVIFLKNGKLHTKEQLVGKKNWTKYLQVVTSTPGDLESYLASHKMKFEKISKYKFSIEILASEITQYQLIFKKKGFKIWDYEIKEDSLSQIYSRLYGGE